MADDRLQPPALWRVRTEADVADEIEAMYIGDFESWLSRPRRNRGEKPISSIRHVVGSRKVRLRFPDGSAFDVIVRRHRKTETREEPSVK